MYVDSGHETMVDVAGAGGLHLPKMQAI